MNKVIEENKITEQNVLRVFCMKFLEDDEILLSKGDIKLIKDCLRKIASCEKNILDEKYEDSKKYGLDFDFEKMEGDKANCLGYFGKKDNNCFVRLKDDFYDTTVRYSKDELTKKFLSQINTVFHELNHFEQRLQMESDKYVSYNSYRMAQEEIIRSQPGTFYKENYWTMLIEMDSRLNAYKKVENLIDNLENNYKFKDFLKQNMRITDMPEYIENIYGVTPRKVSDKGFQDSEAVRNQMVHKYIVMYPQYLKIYPVLMYRYNKNCSRKNILDIINDLPNYANDNEKIKILIETLTEAVEEASVEELKEVENAYPNSAGHIYEFLSDENKIRFKQEKEWIKNLKDNDVLTYTEHNKFVDKKLEEILEAKYKRRFEMLNFYQEGRYEEGYNVINYNLQKGVDVSLREMKSVSDFDNNIHHLFVREKFIDVYDKTESDVDFINRQCNEDAKIAYVLNAVSTGKVPSRIYRKITRNYPNFTKDNFKVLASFFKVAEDLTLPGGKNYLTELYNIPEIQNVAEEMFKSDAYQEIFEESRLHPQQLKKTELDTDYEIAEGYLRTCEFPENELSEFTMNEIHSIGENAVEEDVAMWKITTLQKGYSLSFEDGDWLRSREPIYLKSRRDLIMEDVAKVAMKKNISFDQMQKVNLKEDQIKNKEGVEQDD